MLKIIGNLQCDPATISQYFSEDYVQYVDNKVLDLQGLISHMGSLPNRFSSMKLTFIELIAEGNKVLSSHIVDAISHEGNHHMMQSMAIFEITNDKITNCSELTRTIDDPPNDALAQNILNIRPR